MARPLRRVRRCSRASVLLSAALGLYCASHPLPVAADPRPSSSPNGPTVAAPTSPAPASDAGRGAAPAPAPAASTATTQPANLAHPPAATQRPLEYTREITPSDLADRSLRELSLMRNLPYARHGHTFRRPWLVTYFTAQSWYRSLGRMIADSELSPLDRRNVELVTRYDVGLDRATLERLRDALLARDHNHQLREGDEVEAVLLSARLGTRVALASADGSLPRDSSPLDEPDRLDSLLDVAALRQLSNRDLRILRNMIAARRGRPFTAPTLTAYFENAAWYHPTADYNDARLRRIDRQNIRLIQSVEAEIGGPVTEQQIHEEDTFEGA